MNILLVTHLKIEAVLAKMINDLQTEYLCLITTVMIKLSGPKL